MSKNSLTLWFNIAPSRIGLHVLSQESPIVALGFCVSTKSLVKASLKTPCVDDTSSQYLNIKSSPNLALKNLCTREKICHNRSQNGDAPPVGTDHLSQSSLIA